MAHEHDPTRGVLGVVLFGDFRVAAVGREAVVRASEIEKLGDIHVEGLGEGEKSVETGVHRSSWFGLALLELLIGVAGDA